ncbi:MAG TPA: hypothetical protein VMR62_37235 [Bryobacteraceae bacterium]|jgi:hypothetical protein|nr:hypothetical protein [Bryobacteraceae bacterium]
MPTQRTEWAEYRVEEFLSLPFISEFVFRSVRSDVNKKQEEVADFVILHRGACLLIELKCQEDPSSRTAMKAELWARKKAKEGWSQLRRAFTRPRKFPVWCDHPRLGRHVEFRDGLPPIQHGIVLVEVFEPVDLQPEAGGLPLDHDGVPITYLSVNDFLNLAVQLRSVPELMDYLRARLSLPAADLRLIGDEMTLFTLYLLNDGSFAGCDGHGDARIVVADHQDRVRAALEGKFEADRYAYVLEHVADELASRDPKFSEGLPPELLSAYDPAANRQNYLEMQAALADLRLRERAELGRALIGSIERVADKRQGLTFRAARFDSMPEWVYVLGASKGVERAELLPRLTVLMGGAMAFYGKRKCLVIVDRDNNGYEVALSRPGVRPTRAHVEAGKRLFGGLRITSTPLHFLPEC